MSLKWLGGTCRMEKNRPKGCHSASDWACFNEASNGVRAKGYQNICQNNYGIVCLTIIVTVIIPVSYTHLTLPTILLV